uniref:Uncharacterized protein n=1 Tax=Bionectria ochroleuca TaxID=29856 RepID=A0A8H7KED2_BIOOC
MGQLMKLPNLDLQKGAAEARQRLKGPRTAGLSDPIRPLATPSVAAPPLSSFPAAITNLSARSGDGLTATWIGVAVRCCLRFSSRETVRARNAPTPPALWTAIQRHWCSECLK